MLKQQFAHLHDEGLAAHNDFELIGSGYENKQTNFHLMIF